MQSLTSCHDADRSIQAKEDYIWRVHTLYYSYLVMECETEEQAPEITQNAESFQLRLINIVCR